MDYPEALTKGTRPIEKKQHEIEFRHVSFAYPKTDRKVLDEIRKEMNEPCSSEN